MNAPRMELSELVARVDLPALVERYAGHGRHSGGGWLYCCPHPDHPDRHPSFSVRQDRSGKWWWRCHSQCGEGGDALDLLKWLEHLTTTDAAGRLRDFLGMPADYGSPLPAKKAAPPAPRPPLPEITQTLPAETAGRLMADYLAARAWPEEVVQAFELSVVLDPRGRPYIRHPFLVPDSEGQKVETWQDRAWPTGTPKWVAPAGRPLPLYNVTELELDHITSVVVCEGPADTITASLALAGSADTASVGVAGAGGWKPEWACLFAGLVVVIATDSDPAGEELAGKVAADLIGTAARVVRVRPSAGDLTDTARRQGLGAVTALLLSALGAVAA